MSEIEKMYRNARVKKKWNSTPYGGVEEYYPPFTAEKQIELIKWLAGFYVHINNKGEVINISTGDGYISYYAGNLADAIALYINSKWDNLTEEEKQQVKGILE